MTTDAQDALAKVREALAAGPTPGPRFRGQSPHSYCVYDKRCWYAPDGSRHGDTPNLVITVSPDDAEADAAYIAAADPETIAALLDRLDKAERERERLREFERSAALTLPGVYYMDPPDGGDVPVLEQLRRMAKDAARYRWLRGREDGRYMTVYAFRTDIDEVCLGDELDAAIDAAMGLARPAGGS